MFRLEHSVEFRKGKAGRGLDFDTGTVSVEVQEAKSKTREPRLGARLGSARGPSRRQVSPGRPRVPELGRLAV
jgi:hypothetical protein